MHRNEYILTSCPTFEWLINFVNSVYFKNWCYSTHLLDWPKSSLAFFCNIWGKNPDGIFSQPSVWLFLFSPSLASPNMFSQQLKESFKNLHQSCHCLTCTHSRFPVSSPQPYPASSLPVWSLLSILLDLLWVSVPWISQAFSTIAPSAWNILGSFSPFRLDKASLPQRGPQ